MTAADEPRVYQARRCNDDACGLRFPVEQGSELGALCPRCGRPTCFVDEPYTTHGAPEPGAATSAPIEVLLDNIRSVRNVGTIFRSADGAGVRHLYLGGITPTPEHPKLPKTALGAEAFVPWTQHADPAVLAAQLRAQGRTLWAIEGGPEATSIYAAGPAPQNVVLVFGHEVSGIDARVLDQCQRRFFIPMLGHKRTLNVAVAMGVVAYALRFG